MNIYNSSNAINESNPNTCCSLNQQYAIHSYNGWVHALKEYPHTRSHVATTLVLHETAL